MSANGNPKGRSVAPNENGVQLRRLPVGTVFNDFYGKQVFIKEGEVATKQGKRHRLRCIVSPFLKTGPISSAFFCAVGKVIFREGGLRVFPIESGRLHEQLLRKEAA